MTTSSASQDLTAAIGTHLPYLRRYARALTGTQASGDAYAAATLEAILEDRSVFDMGLSPKVALFKVLHNLWQNTDLTMPGEIPDGIEGAAQKHLASLTANTREALLLSTIEDFNDQEVAQIMSIDPEEVVEFVEGIGLPVIIKVRCIVGQWV